MDLSNAIKQQGRQLGFDLVGITTSEPIGPEDTGHLKDWLNDGCPDELQYMHRNIEVRTNPAELLDNARSVICAGLNYKPARIANGNPANARIANFALYEDYHTFIRKLLHKLCDFIKDEISPKEARFKVCVDTAPIMERALAQRAGIGFIGKNHLLIHPQLGLQLLLGEIVTDLKLPSDTPMTNKCPDCNKCVRGCPSGALAEDGSFDGRKCISFLNQYSTEPATRQNLSRFVFGCDECILSCPFNINAPQRANGDFKFFAERAVLSPAEIINWNQRDFDNHFTGSPVERLGLERLKLNANACLKNECPSGD
jgi:epoxyqueuosine reductase